MNYKFFSKHYLDNLVSVIDEKVEKHPQTTTDDYTAKVMNFLINS